MTPLSEEKLLTAGNVTTSDEVHKLNENITTSAEVVKGNDEVKKRKEKITTNEEVDKGTEKLKYMKEAVVTISGKDSDKFEGQSKGYTGWFNLDHKCLKKHLNQTSIKTLRKGY